MISKQKHHSKQYGSQLGSNEEVNTETAFVMIATTESVSMATA